MLENYPLQPINNYVFQAKQFTIIKSLEFFEKHKKTELERTDKIPNAIDNPTTF